MIPGLENAEFIRYGVMHRNTYINSPMLLDNTYRMIKYNKTFFAGQITGVEGYVESASSGLLCGIYASNAENGIANIPYSSETAIGALANYVSNQSITNFQPMNVNFGIMKELNQRIKDKKLKAEEYAKRSFIEIDTKN